MMVAAVVTSMGRLAQLRVSMPMLLAHTEMKLCLVDYSCPDGSGAWAERVLAGGSWRDRIRVERSGPRPVFNKCEALNLGCRAAVERWKPQWLCVLDADTLVTPALWEWMVENLSSGRYYFFEGYKPRQDLSGVLVVSAEDFVLSGGYDEGFDGWGAEDFDMRCRLFFKLGRPYQEIPCGLARSIPHSDEQRVRFYGVKEKRVSHLANQYRLIENVRRWTGKDLRDLRLNEVRALFGMRRDQLQ